MKELTKHIDWILNQVSAELIILRNGVHMFQQEQMKTPKRIEDSLHQVPIMQENLALAQKELEVLLTLAQIKKLEE